MPLRQARGFADEQVKRGRVVLEHRAVRALPLRALTLGLALRMGRLGDFADIFRRMEKIDQLAIGVLFEEPPELLAAPSAMPRYSAVGRRCLARRISRSMRCRNACLPYSGAAAR